MQVVDQSRSQESSWRATTAAVLEAEAAARGMNIAGYAQLLEDRRAGIVAAEAEVDKERGARSGRKWRSARRRLRSRRRWRRRRS